MRGGDFMKNTQNITLSLPKDLLIKVKHLAIDRHTSVSGLLAEMIKNSVVKQDEYIKAKRHYLDIIDQKYDINSGEKYSWKREELHDR